MTRQEFESLPSHIQRKYAEREYSKVSKKMLKEFENQGIFWDDFGVLAETHHCWSRAHCPLWLIFQKENLFPISKELHRIIHDKAPSDMAPLEKQYYDAIQKQKEKLQNDEKIYTSSNPA
jgi:hypothetical protein